MWPVTEPLVMCMHGYTRGVPAVMFYPYPAVFCKLPFASFIKMVTRDLHKLEEIGNIGIRSLTT